MPDGQLKLPGIETGAGTEPLARTELDVAFPSRIRHEPNDVRLADIRLSAVQFAGEDEREDTTDIEVAATTVPTPGAVVIAAMVDSYAQSPANCCSTIAN